MIRICWIEPRRAIWHSGYHYLFHGVGILMRSNANENGNLSNPGQRHSCTG